MVNPFRGVKPGSDARYLLLFPGAVNGSACGIMADALLEATAGGQAAKAKRVGIGRSS